MYSKCKRMVGLLLICVLALGVSAAAFETQIEPRDNWHDYTGELPADTGDVEVSTVKKHIQTTILLCLANHRDPD